jgi:hypothetical protein
LFVKLPKAFVLVLSVGDRVQLAYRRQLSLFMKNEFFDPVSLVHDIKLPVDPCDITGELLPICLIRKVKNLDCILVVKDPLVGGEEAGVLGGDLGPVKGVRPVLSGFTHLGGHGYFAVGDLGQSPLEPEHGLVPLL